MARTQRAHGPLLIFAFAATCATNLLACSDDSGDQPSVTDPDGENPGPSEPGGQDPSDDLEAQAKILEEDRATAIWNGPLSSGDQRPVIVSMPGWEGTQDRKNDITRLDRQLRDEGYVVLTIGFDYLGYFQSNLLESVKLNLDRLCDDATIPADCSSVLLLGNSYSGMQNNYVFNHLEFNGYSAQDDRQVLGFVSVNAGYAPPGQITDAFGSFTRQGLADGDKVGIALIQNREDEVFPINACTWGNCGVRTLSSAHRAENHVNFFSACPAGGTHATTEYEHWDDWIISAVKTIIHTQFNRPTFSDYTIPLILVANDCI